MRICGHKLSVTAQIGIVIVVINLLVALFAPLIAPFDQATPVGDAWADPERAALARARQSRPRHL